MLERHRVQPCGTSYWKYRLDISTQVDRVAGVGVDEGLESVRETIHPGLGRCGVAHVAAAIIAHHRHVRDVRVVAALVGRVDLVQQRWLPLVTIERDIQTRMAILTRGAITHCALIVQAGELERRNAALGQQYDRVERRELRDSDHDLSIRCARDRSQREQRRNCHGLPAVRFILRRREAGEQVGSGGRCIRGAARIGR
eukprot:1876211-Prymnesium_polylepis.1